MKYICRLRTAMSRRLFIPAWSDCSSLIATTLGTSSSSGLASTGSPCSDCGVRPPLTAATFHKSHFALALSLAKLLAAGERLRRSGVTCQDFQGEETIVPSVIGWMPSAQLYFRDPDGHSVEFIALLDDPPDSSFVGSLSERRKRPNQAMQRIASFTTTNPSEGGQGCD
jgi:hypothetical protein